MKTARAAVFTSPRAPMQLREFAVPRPGPGEILVRPLRTNVCGSDLHIWRGEMGLDTLGITYPLILGHEMVSEVVEAGSGRDFRTGDRIACTPVFICGTCRACLAGNTFACVNALFAGVRPCEEPPHFVGGFAEYYLVDPKQPAFRVPDELPTEIAAAANCAVAQVLFGFERAGLRYGESVIVQGAGGLGLYATCAAREMGASKIIVIDAIAARLELARAFGADEVLDASEVADPKDRTRMVLQWTEGWGADIVLELAGIPDVVPEGIRMLARCGRYVEIGNIAPRKTYKADPSLVVGGNKTIIGVADYPARSLSQALDFLSRVHRKYPLARMTRSFPFEEIDRAFHSADAFGSEKTEVVRASICLR